MNVLKFTLKDTEIDIVIVKNTIAFALEKSGNHFGNKIKLPSKKTQDIVAATFLLLINALETLENYENGNVQSAIATVG